MCKNYDYCYIKMPEKGKNIIKYNQGEKYMSSPFVIYADTQSLQEKEDTCHNDPGKSTAIKLSKPTACRYLLFTHCSFDSNKNNLNYYGDKDCMKNLCKDLKGHATEIINYEKQEIIPLTKEGKKPHHKQKFCYLKFCQNQRISRRI